MGTAPQAAPNPNQRQQFASLFPNDPVSGLINAQQPTRLMAEGGAVGALRGFGNQIANKLTQPIQAKTAQIQPFLDEVKSMAEDRFGVELNGLGGIGQMPTGLQTQNRLGIAQNPQSLLEQMQNRFSDAAQNNVTEPKDYSMSGTRPAYMPIDEDGDGIDQFGAVMPEFEANQGSPMTLSDANSAFRKGMSGLKSSAFGAGGSRIAGIGSLASLFMGKGGAVPPRQVDIKGQPHMLAYITPQEGGILKLLGGSGAPGPMGIPQFGFGDGDVGDEGGDADTGTEEGGSDGPGGGNGGGDGNDDNYGSYADDTSGYSTVGVDSSYSPDVGGTTYGGSIAGAIASSSPSMGNPAYSGATNTGMGLDDSIADMAAVMGGQSGYTGGGLTGGVKNTQNVQGSKNYSPVGPIPFDIFNLRDKMNQKARDSLTMGKQPGFAVDPYGNITGVTGPSVPGSSFMGIPTNPISAIAMLGNMMGATTTTGYNMDTGPDIGDSGPDPEYMRRPSGIQTIRPKEEYKKAKKIVSPLDIYLANVDKYRVRGM